MVILMARISPSEGIALDSVFDLSYLDNVSTEGGRRKHAYRKAEGKTITIDRKRFPSIESAILVSRRCIAAGRKRNPKASYKLDYLGGGFELYFYDTNKHYSIQSRTICLANWYSSVRRFIARCVVHVLPRLLQFRKRLFNCTAKAVVRERPGFTDIHT